MPRPVSHGPSRVVYDDFSGGDFGVLRGFRAPSNTFSGTDVVAYLDGSVGPRCGLTTIASDSMPTGKVAGFGFFSQDVGSEMPWVVIGTAVYASVATPVALTGALAVTPTEPIPGVAFGSTVYIVNPGDKVYSITTTTVTAVANTPGARNIVLYGDRLLTANSSGLTNRIRYSDANLFDTWDSDGFFDVGQGGSITGMWTVRSSVYISKDDGTWWIYSGVPGSGTDVLRLAYTGVSYPADFRSGAVVGGSNVWFVAKGENFPSWFNGTNVNTVAEQDTLERTYSTAAVDVESKVNIVALSRRGDMLVLAGSGLTSRVTLLYRDGKWSRHSVSTPLGAAVPGATGRVMVTDGGAAVTAPVFYWWLPAGLERPGLGGTYDAVSDADLSAELELPEHVDAQGRALQVRRVTVDFRKYNPDGVNNHFAGTLTSTRNIDDGPDADGVTRVFDQSSSNGSASGVPSQVTFDGGDTGMSPGFKFALADMVGVAIERVCVDFNLGEPVP